ncbi:hypothetical protein OEZ85_002490 [Tetradesmus obliquus]|uniref:Uncharacterized protein n=1 Tax=Tetradesmus obliquus TaxID=3088 RepID=A0ABY8TXN9_TETOB|nr:hypothetical protein OEZ85_002490 [Tetradesmus obliquus]
MRSPRDFDSVSPRADNTLRVDRIHWGWPQVYDNCAAPEKEASHSNSSGQCQAQCSAGGSDNFSRVQRRGHFPGPSHRTCVIGRLLRRRKAQPQRMRMTTGC